MSEIGLYIHIPFCKSKCYYCDFNSFPGRDNLISPYFDALRKEIAYYGSILRDLTVKTVFIGGGTPSYVDAENIRAILSMCRQSFDIENGAETSIEANPGTLSPEKLASYREMGINRLSIGLQAWQNSLLKKMGRIHCAGEFVENYRQARKAGFENINVDLIFGLPGQTLDEWKETVVNVVGLKPEHVSCYSLKIEENTVFGERLSRGELVPADDEIDRSMYYFAIKELAEYGYKHYEISNFAKPGFECKHNLIYWKAERYLGLGAGAHSYLGDRRYNNIPDVESYINLLQHAEAPVEESNVINVNESMSEYVILGLRLIDGVSASGFRARYGMDISSIFGDRIDRLEKRQLLKAEGDRIKLSGIGLDVANQVFIEFLE